MIMIKDYPGTNILEFVVDDGISKSEFQLVADRIDEIIATHGKVRLIEVIEKIGSVEPAALWADMKFGPSHLKYVSHVAVVADKKWIEWIAKMARPFLSAELRLFGLDEVAAAREWIFHAPQEPSN